ncbi:MULTISPECIES: L,D-transpeptidase family protein [Thermomonosporaceae]|uniref:L,D-transpeptidase family protein n=1 Tax=Thermomonosporaceae TaxID=2012 RepID=UPI00255AA50D|nr:MULTISPECIES: L,D-transpeptidase family protein [Thermomonosporaceae]MDL4773891.1 L,D-transpeptidase family protein [Actinomadura xylanilytica]
MSTRARPRPHGRRAVLALLCLGAALATVAVHAPSATAKERGAVRPCQALGLGLSRYGAGSARHVLFAVAADYGTTEVAITECTRRGVFWRQTLTAPGHVGRNGFAEPGAKREGDGKTPTGSHSLTEAFGEGDPGTALPYRTLRESGDCWGSTIGDGRYNRYYPGECAPADENLSEYMRSGPYKQAVVIDYNRPPDSPIVQGNGSAIFMHIGAAPTAGCVALARPELETVMRTLHPRDRIIMGTRQALFP